MFLRFFMTIFLYRVNSVWKAELDTLRLEQRVQFVDHTEYLRQFVRSKNCRGEDNQGSDDESLIRSWLKWDDSFRSRCLELSGKMRYVADRYSTVQNGTVVVKFHDGFDYDSYIAEKFWPISGAGLSSCTLECALGFQKADRLIFVDSVLSESFLTYWPTSWPSCRSIGLIRTTVHADVICQHLIQPLYIVNHSTVVDPRRDDAIWAQLLDTFGQLSDMESLSLFRKSLVKRRQKDVGRFDEELASL